jgi:CubicO group peptidase (beta-lactamase class C family)
MRTWIWLVFGGLLLWLVAPVQAEDAAGKQAVLTDYFPPSESKGGWRTLLPAKGEPSAEQKAKIRSVAGINWDKLKEAWEYNAAIGNKTGLKTTLLVIRHGQVAGEWYQEGGPTKTFNIYSSSKAYTSTAFGQLLADSDAGKLPGGKHLTLDTKVCNAEWLPESLPLPDPRKADITLRNLLNMASGLGTEAVPEQAPFEWSLGHVEGSPMAKLKGEPGTVYNYSNAGVAHLVLLFQHAAGRDLFPFMKARVFDPIGMERVTWTKIGGHGKLGPYSQGYSGVNTTPREHARFCYLALHRGTWANKQIVPAHYYDFAWQGIKIKPDYGAQWWVYPRHPEAPKDLVQTAGAYFNNGYVVPSLDLVVIRLGDGLKTPPPKGKEPPFPKDFDQTLVKKVLAAVER